MVLMMIMMMFKRPFISDKRMFKRPFGRECSTDYWTRTAHLVARLKPAPLEDWQLEQSKEGSKDVRTKEMKAKKGLGEEKYRQAYLLESSSTNQMERPFVDF